MAYDDGPFDYRRVSGSVAPAFRPNRSVKRAFDIVAAGIGLLLFSPILLIVSIAIKLDSRGPVFCRETRYGYKDREIRSLKISIDDGLRRSRPNQFVRDTGWSGPTTDWY